MKYFGFKESGFCKRVRWGIDRRKEFVFQFNLFYFEKVIYYS